MGKILQLELSVQNIGHPVNRVIEIPEDMTFEQLYLAIYRLFDCFEESCLFHIKKSNGKEEDGFIGEDYE